ncbi:GGDEF domain-containing protein [Clostridium sp. YIM B02505]|uniref:GGDEF domain-containing protein n=1 Tax=Clostridium yunnanense TaxID=2800325 RepID=A0ABS1EW46_9CLOT|nr:GGDEF domain-containing protein [Clostridium yunnanense]MBK1813565.1 GGDEF domain-containing protein [Clostridium yunnanense]
MLKRIKEVLFSAIDTSYDEELIQLRNKLNYKRSYFALRITAFIAAILMIASFIYGSIYDFQLYKYNISNYRFYYLALFCISIVFLLLLNLIKKKKKFIEKHFSYVQIVMIFVVIIWAIAYMESSSDQSITNSIPYNQILFSCAAIFYLSKRQIILTYGLVHIIFIGDFIRIHGYANNTIFFINITLTLVVSIIIAIKNYDNMIERHKQDISIRNKNLSLMKMNNSLHFANKKLKDMSDKDFLTNIANKRKLDRMTYMYWNSLKKFSSSLSIMIADIDFFKQYNDFYGHVKGDSCLVKIATTINEVVEKNLGIVGRYGGEEFFVILPNRNFDEAVAICEEIRKRIEEERILNEALGEDKYVTISAGVATVVPTDDFNLDFFINICDNKLYEAKKKGRNRIESIYL